VRASAGRGEVDLVALDDPTRDESGVVRLQLGRRERLDAAQEPGMDADRGADEIVVEEVLHLVPRTGSHRTCCTWRVCVRPFCSYVSVV
jgi:hypothetical protein